MYDDLVNVIHCLSIHCDGGHICLIIDRSSVYVGLGNLGHESTLEGKQTTM